MLAKQSLHQQLRKQRTATQPFDKLTQLPVFRGGNRRFWARRFLRWRHPKQIRCTHDFWKLIGPRLGLLVMPKMHGYLYEAKLPTTFAVAESRFDQQHSYVDPNWAIFLLMEQVCPPAMHDNPAIAGRMERERKRSLQVFAVWRMNFVPIASKLWLVVRNDGEGLFLDATQTCPTTYRIHAGVRVLSMLSSL